MEMVIRGARLIDGIGLARIEDGAVLISEDRIAKVAPFAEFDPPAAARWSTCAIIRSRPASSTS